MDMLLTFFLVIMFQHSFTKFLSMYANIGSDIKLYRAERVLVSILKKEIEYASKTVAITDDADFGTVDCSEYGDRRTVTYYCRETAEEIGATLYRSTKVVGKAAGINPLSPPEVQMTQWHLYKTSATSFVMVLGFREKGSMRERVFIEEVSLCNGQLL